jgi:hypothetical protein
MRRVDYGPKYWSIRGWKGWCGTIVNIILICIGLFFLSGGTYASVQSIIYGYEGDTFGGPFTCAYNGL